MFHHYSKGFSKQQLINLKFPHTILQTRLHFNAEVVSFVPESRFGWTFYSPGMLNESTLWYGWILCPSQHSGLTQPPAEWGVMNSVGGRHREWGGGCWNWGTDFAHLSHMAERAQRGQLSLNKHNHFLLAAHKAFKQKPVRRSSPGHLGERTASRQNTAGSVWLSVCRHPGKAQTWSCFSTPPLTQDCYIRLSICTGNISGHLLTDKNLNNCQSLRERYQLFSLISSKHISN